MVVLNADTAISAGPPASMRSGPGGLETPHGPIPNRDSAGHAIPRAQNSPHPPVTGVGVSTVDLEAGYIQPAPPASVKRDDQPPAKKKSTVGKNRSKTKATAQKSKRHAIPADLFSDASGHNPKMGRMSEDICTARDDSRPADAAPYQGRGPREDPGRPAGLVRSEPTGLLAKRAPGMSAAKSQSDMNQSSVSLFSMFWGSRGTAVTRYYILPKITRYFILAEPIVEEGKKARRKRQRFSSSDSHQSSSGSPHRTKRH